LKFENNRLYIDLKAICWGEVLSTEQEMFLATNAINTHAQDFVANDEFLLPILKV
jgi:hypothetical protein